MPPPLERSVCSARVQPSTTGSTASRWLGFGASVIVTSPEARLARPGRGEVVLDVAGAALVVDDDGLDRPLALELAQDRLVRAADRVHEHVQAAAVRHPDHDLVGPGVGRELDRLVEHRHHRVEALERELLLAEERTAQVLLEPLGARERLQQADPLLGRERLPVAAGLDRLPEPDALGVVGQVLDLVRHRPAVDGAQVRERLLERLAGDVDAQELGGDARLQLGGQRRDQPRLVERGVAERLRAERIEPRRQVPVHAVGLDERHRRGDAAEQRLVDRRPGRRLCGRGRRAGAGAGAAGAATDAGAASRRVAPLPSSSVSSRRSSPGCDGDELAVAALEQRAPLGRDGVRILEIVLEQQPGVAGVRPVDVVCAHSVCCSSADRRTPSRGDSR